MQKCLGIYIESNIIKYESAQRFFVFILLILILLKISPKKFLFIP